MSIWFERDFYVLNPPPLPPDAALIVPDRSLVFAPELLHPWRQPTRPVTLDRTHPFMDGLVSCWALWQSAPTFCPDLNGRVNATYTGATNPGIQIGHDQYGRGTQVSNDASNAALDLGTVDSSHPLSMSSGNEVSVFAFGTFPTSTESGTTSPRVIDCGNGSNGTGGWMFCPLTTTNNLYFAVNNTTTVQSNSGVLTQRRTHTMGVSAASGDIDFFVNGRSAGHFTNGYTIPTTSTPGRLLNWNSTDRQWRGRPMHLIMVWDKKVDDSVMYTLSLDPYCMFVPV